MIKLNPNSLKIRNSDGQWESLNVWGGQSGGSDVQVTPYLFDGTKIATISVDGVPVDVYSPNGGSGDASIDDTTISTKTTWSSQKISTEIDSVIDDTATIATDVTWSAGKIATEIANAGSKIDVDDTLSTTSINPVQNKVITSELSKNETQITSVADRVTILEQSYVSGETIYSDTEIASAIAAVLGGVV